MQRTEQLCDKFRSLGLKVTPQRRHIFQVLEGNGSHPSADEVYDRVKVSMPDISLATVYNTLRELVNLGEIRSLDLGEGRSRYDPHTDGHHHLSCVRCRGVVDVACDTHALELAPEQQHGHRILGADVTFYGVCPTCLEQESVNQTAPSLRMWGVPASD